MNKAIVLMNLGSPDSTDLKDVRKYLNKFLMDKKVIDSPYLLRMLLVKGIIVPFRALKSAEAYKTIWTKKGSPLIVLSKQLQEAIKENLEEPVAIAMRYGSPSPKETFDQLRNENPDLEEILLMPMYPHYAMSSYETAVDYANAIHKKYKYNFKLNVIKPYYNDEDYIQALTESIKPFLNEEYDCILFSYHGVPERHIYKGDITGKHCLKVGDCCEKGSPAHAFCYRHQCWTTTRLVTQQLKIPKEKWGLSFQSRLGRSEWLKPYTAMRLAELPDEGVKKLLVVCPAFVSDCLETLDEIAEEGKHIFVNAGGKSFTMIPCLNVHPIWVQTLVKWIKQSFSGDIKMLVQ